MKKFDVVGIDSPCQDFVMNLDHLPKPNQGVRVNACSWQGGGKVASGIISSARQGVSCAIIGAMGDDLFGRYCFNDFQRHNINVDNMLLRPGQYTMFNVVLSDKETMGRSILGTGGTTEAIRYEEIDEELLKNTKYFYVAHFSEVVKKATLTARDAGAKIFIDADNYNEALMENIGLVDAFVGSEFVYNALFEDTNYEANCKAVAAKGPSIVVFTFGEKGCVGYSEETGYFELPAFHVDATDTLGAGDVFHGAYVAALVYGMDARESARYASAVSAIKCTRIGGRSGIPTKEMVERFLATGEIDYTELDQRVEYYRRGIYHV